jgi:lysozyme
MYRWRDDRLQFHHQLLWHQECWDAGRRIYVFHPAQDPVVQARLLITKLHQAGFAPGDLSPEIDVEVADNQVSTTIASNLLTAVTTIRNTLHVTPVIYTFTYFWNQYISPTRFGGQFGGDPLWIFSLTPSCPSVPSGWSTWTVWQYSITGTVPGITVANAVDLDRTNEPNLPVYLAVRTYLPMVFAGGT